MTPPEEKRKAGRPQRYVLWKDWERWIVTQWQPFKTNEFWHLRKKVDLSLWLSGGILLTVIAKLVIDFLWG